VRYSTTNQRIGVLESSDIARTVSGRRGRRLDRHANIRSLCRRDRGSPAAELQAALDREDLRYAMSLADELRLERGRPISLEIAAKFLPLIAKESPREYDAWALRWLNRWITETPAVTIEQAAETAASLADLPCEPMMLERLPFGVSSA
jgi:hypothetical protein